MPSSVGKKKPDGFTNEKCAQKNKIAHWKYANRISLLVIVAYAIKFFQLSGKYRRIETVGNSICNILKIFFKIELYRIINISFYVSVSFSSIKHIYISIISIFFVPRQ